MSAPTPVLLIQVFYGFHVYLRENTGIEPRLGHIHWPNPFQFIIHESCHSALVGDTDSAYKYCPPPQVTEC
jgi:hypothetical protein